MEYTTRIIGAPNTFGGPWLPSDLKRASGTDFGIFGVIEHRVFIEDKATKTVLSPFHDIPLWANEQKARADSPATIGIDI